MTEKELDINTEDGTLEEKEVEQAPAKMTRGNILKALAGAIANGNISSSQARQIRLDLGMTQADFTRKQPTEAQRKARRKMQKESRRRNRGLGKGQKKSGRF